MIISKYGLIAKRKKVVIIDLIKKYKTTLNLFFEEIPSSLFCLTGEQLANELNITEGVSFNNETSWLHFVKNGVDYFIPKKPIRHSISWNHLYKKGAVYGTGTENADNDYIDDTTPRTIQNAQVTINSGNYAGTYKVRLLKGCNTNPRKHNDIIWSKKTENEWSYFIYSVFSNKAQKHDIPQLSNYTCNDLCFTDKGRWNLCQETWSSASYNSRLVRGSYNQEDFGAEGSYVQADDSLGWRPVLVKIS